MLKTNYILYILWRWLTCLWVASGFPVTLRTGTDAPRRVKAATHEGHPAPWLAGELDPKGAQSETAPGSSFSQALLTQVHILLLAVLFQVLPYSGPPPSGTVATEPPSCRSRESLGAARFPRAKECQPLAGRPHALSARRCLRFSSCSLHFL